MSEKEKLWQIQTRQPQIRRRRPELRKKGSWSKGLKTEWDKIVWTDRKTLLKQTGYVVGVSVVLCLLITLIDNLGLQLIQLVIG